MDEISEGRVVELVKEYLQQYLEVSIKEDGYFERGITVELRLCGQVISSDSFNIKEG